MKQFRFLVAGVFLLVICGCNAVVSKRPVGETPAKIVAKDWEGNWFTSDGSVKIKVVDADKGMLRVFWLEDEDKSKPSMKSAEVELRGSGEWMFANTKEENKNGSRGYVWGRIKNEARQMIVWIPDDKAFAQLVKSGFFPGKIEGNDVILDELKPEHLKMITSGEKGILFTWDKPIVFMKIGT